MIEKLKSTPVRDLASKGIKLLYRRYIRQYIPPTRVVNYNSVLVKKKRVFDKYVRDIGEDDPEYEGPLCSFIRDYVRTGDDVVVVGGGWGVSAVVAARETGESGSVHIYEAGKRQYKRVISTINLNCVADRCNVHHATVGTAVGAFNSPKDATELTGADLPDADVLVVDCDGAEFEVMETLTTYPEQIIVEHHAVGTPDNIKVEYRPTRVKNKLSEMGYSIKGSSEINHWIDKNAHWVGVHQ